jgi:hypothetical protein
MFTYAPPYLFSLLLIQTGRAGLEDYLRLKGDPSLTVETWLRALRPQELDRGAFVRLMTALPTLTPAEDAAAAALFFGFAEGMSDDPPSYAVFHASLLTAEPIIGDGEFLAPAFIYNYVGSREASRDLVTAFALFSMRIELARAHALEGRRFEGEEGDVTLNQAVQKELETSALSDPALKRTVRTFYAASENLSLTTIFLSKSE